MKRVYLFGAVIALVSVLAFGGPLERFAKVDDVTVSASVKRYYVSTYNGETFTPEKLSYHLYSSNDAAAVCTMTVYIAGKGPLSCRDSSRVLFQMAGANDNAWGEYYGPMSDSMYVSTPATLYIQMQTFGN